MGEAAPYNAAVDINATPRSPGDVILSDDPTSEPVHVQCALAARLRPVGSGIEVAENDAQVDGGWVYREFTPSGVAEWNWDVTTKSSKDQRLRLELMPAIEHGNIFTRASAHTADFYTNVHVEASPVQRLSVWFQTDWKLIATIAGAIGVAVLGLLGFRAKLSEALKKSRGTAPEEVVASKSKRPPSKARKK